MFVCRKNGICRHQDRTGKNPLCCRYAPCEYKEEIDDEHHDILDELH